MADEQMILGTTIRQVEIRYVTVMLAVATFERIALKGLSPETKKWYRTRLHRIANELGETRRLSDVLDIDLIQLSEKWENQKLSPDTLHGYIRALRRFFHWLHDRGMVTADLVHDIPLPKLPKRGRCGISDKNAELIIEAAKKHNPRDYALLLFFASTSARLAGATGVQLKDLNLDAPEPICRQVQVFEKGGKERTVIMGHETHRALLEYLKIRPSGSQYVFVTDKGKPLQSSSMSEIIDRYKKRLGLKGPCSPHQWRHRWFRKLLQDHMPISQAAQIGGHTSINITYQFYGQFAFGELQDAYDRHSQNLE